jgi:putative SOS response-associated peptidase YedK
MCGRYTLRANPRQLAEAFAVLRTPEVVPRFNVAPTQPILTIRDAGDGLAAELVKWGLVPSWAKDPSIGNKLINARAETVREKPAFRAAFKRRRCVIAADGFYEWQRLDGRGKQPWFFRLPDDEPFGFAGLWETWEAPDGSAVETACIVTTEANATVAPVHDRMPVILPPEDHARWLDPEADGGPALLRLLRPYEGPMDAYPVPSRVNSPKFDAPELVARNSA